MLAVPYVETCCRLKKQSLLKIKESVMSVEKRRSESLTHIVQYVEE